MAKRVRIEDDEEEKPRKKVVREASADADDDGIDAYRKLLLIDKYALDEALEQQADMLFRISERSVQLMSQRDAAKLEVSEAEAMADASIRRAASIAEEKITADQVKANVKLDRDVVRANERYARLVHLHNRWSSLKEAFIERGKAMRELVNLYASNYWSDASAGRASIRNRDHAGEEAREAMARERRKG